MERWKLIVDIGGTNVRFARSLGPGDLSDIKKLSVGGFPTFLASLEAYLDGMERANCDGAAIAGAGPVDQGKIVLTNGPWCISAQEVSEALDAPVALFNDLEAVALSLPHLKEGDLRTLGGAALDLNRRAVRLAINVGTGLGAAGAVPVSESSWVSLASEAGHMSFAAVADDEVAMLGLRESNEDLLSGRGLRWLYSHVRERQGDPAAAVGEDFKVFAQPATDLAAVEAKRIFTRLLGRISGDLVLATAAWGGAFLCGAVARAWSDVADIEDIEAFRAAFEKKGAMSRRMRGVGTSLIVRPEPALYGLTFAVAAFSS